MRAITASAVQRQQTAANTPKRPSNDSSSSDDIYGYSRGSDGWEFHDYEDEADNDLAAPLRARTPPPPPPTTLGPPPPTLCRFFVLGKCRFGSQCTYSHEIPKVLQEHTRGGTSHVSSELMAAVAVLMVDCPYYQRGHCKYGDRCRLRHAPPLPASFAAAPVTVAPPTAAPPTTTGTSTTNASPQEFTCGICLEDVVKLGKHFGLMASNYIVPSLKFCTGAEKEKVVEDYKRHLAIRECKYFNGSLG
ncbi:hypothetical protein ATCC90586_001600 [Pythium insidiosum]|nr:hypothetical protein ATCC90586_001600 [Pythium insidiosum]